MKISIQATIVFAAIFAVICLGVATTGFVSIGDIADPAQAADAQGFAWFWTFLGTVAVGVGALAWWMQRTSRDDDDL